MRDYIKPYIEEEILEIEDVIAASNGGEGDAENGGQSDSAGNLW